MDKTATQEAARGAGKSKTSSGNVPMPGQDAGQMQGQTQDQTQDQMQGDNVSSGQTDTGLNDLAYDWITILAHKTKGLRAYSTYLEDARKANATQCVDLLERIHNSDLQMVAEIKQHLAHVLADKACQKSN